MSYYDTPNVRTTHDKIGYDVMTSMNGFLERRQKKRAVRLDTETENIDSMVRNLPSDV